MQDVHTALAAMSEPERQKVLAAIGARAAVPDDVPAPAPTTRHERRRYAALSRRAQTR